MDLPGQSTLNVLSDREAWRRQRFGKAGIPFAVEMEGCVAVYGRVISDEVTGMACGRRRHNRVVFRLSRMEQQRHARAGLVKRASEKLCQSSC